MQPEPAVAPARRAIFDEQALAALRAGDERAFRDLFARSYPMMKRVARAYVASDAVAEEAAAGESVVAVGCTGDVDGRRNRDRPLRGALGARHLDLLDPDKPGKDSQRARDRTVPFSSVATSDVEGPVVDPDRFQKNDDAWPGHWATPPRPWQKPERRLLSLEARDHLKAALAQLPDRQHMIVGLRDIEGHSAEEVCDLLGLSPENQRALLHRGRARLRAILEEYLNTANV